MEHGARLSTSRVMAIAFIFMSVLIVLSLSVNVIQGVNNYRLQNEQRTAVTPMAFNAPFAVSQNSADASYLQQMALSFIALRLNVSSETVDASHQALLQYIRPGAQNQMKVILAEEAKRIKNDNVKPRCRRVYCVNHNGCGKRSGRSPGKICCRSDCSRWSGIWFVTCRKRKPWAETNTGR